MLSIIVAKAKNNVIGKDNKLIWHLPEDLKNFKNLTTGHTIIMGRKTFESLGRVLPNRKHIVFTRNKDFKIDDENVEVIHEVEDIKDIIEKEEEAFVIGGEKIYKLLLPYTKKMYITNINEDRKDNIKKKGQISNAIKFINEIDEKYDTAQTQWDAVTQAMNEDDKTKLMEVMKVAVVDGSTSNIKTNVYKHLRDSGEQEVTIGNIDQIVEDIARDTGMRDHVTDAQFDEIKDRVRTIHNYAERSYVEQVKNVADEIHRNFIEVKFDGDPAIDVVNTMDEIEGINQKAKKEAKRKVTDVERLITDLRVRE